VPMDPPTATMVICPAVSWWRRPDSTFAEPEFAEGADIKGSYSYIRNRRVRRRKVVLRRSNPRGGATELPHTVRPSAFCGRVFGLIEELSSFAAAQNEPLHDFRNRGEG
jgi:hypothetical protein